MSILGNICASIERIVHQSDEHVIAWSVEDHAECVDRTQKAYQKLQKLHSSTCTRHTTMPSVSRLKNPSLKSLPSL